MAASAIYFFNLFLLSCKRVSETVGLLWKLQNVSPRTSKLFVRPHLNYGDVIYVEAYNFTIHQILESFQYNASLAITGIIKGNFREKIYQEVGLESLQLRKWYRAICFFVRIFNIKSSHYFLIATLSALYQKRNFHSLIQSET